MKYLLTFVCVVFFVTVVQCLSSSEMMKYIRECKQETGCTEDVVKIMKKNEMPKTQEGNCAIACVMKRCGSLESDNTVNTETTKTILVKKMHIKEDKAQTIVDTCKAQVGTQTDPCEAGKIFSKCIMDNKN